MVSTNETEPVIAPALDPRRPVWEDGYLAALAIHGRKVLAAEQADVSRVTVMMRRRASPAFVEREKEAMELAREAIEEEITRLALEGQEQQFPTKSGDIATRIERFPVLLLRLAEKLERGTWSQTQRVEHAVGQTFDTLADRTKRLEEAKAQIASAPAVLELAQPAEVEAVTVEK